MKKKWPVALAPLVQRASAPEKNTGKKKKKQQRTHNYVYLSEQVRAI